MLVIAALKLFLGIFAFMAGYDVPGSVFFNFLLSKICWNCCNKFLTAVDLAMKIGSTGPFHSLCHEDHGMAKVGSGIPRWSSPMHLLKQGRLWEDSVQLGFEFIHGWRLHNLSGKPVSVFDHPLSWSVLLCSDGIFHVSFLAVASCPVAGHHWEEPALSSLHPLIRYLKTFIRFLLSFSRLNSLTSLSLSSYEKCPDLFIILLALHWTQFSKSRSVLYCGAQKWTHCSRCLTSAEWRGRITFPQSAGSSLAVLCLMQPGMLCRKSALLAHGQFAVWQDPRSLHTGTLSSC